MRFVSTRGKAPECGFSEALLKGLASDGGLYQPVELPEIKTTPLKGADFKTVAQTVFTAFAHGDPLAAPQAELIKDTFNFPVVLKDLKRQTSVLELFHGPTAAFKDFGARFLAACTAKISQIPQTVLVATSGDTGGAVAAAFFRRPGFQVAILFPEGRISPRQEKQLTAWGENIKAFAVEGSFDDCQKLAKQAFSEVTDVRLMSANSINIGRILPQTFYYAWSSLEYVARHGEAPGFIIPSGNLGNSLACVWAMEMGFPIREIVLAHNANRAVPDYFQKKTFAPQPTLATLANAMDVGNPSNMERLLHLIEKRPHILTRLSAYSVGDDLIRETIKAGISEWNEVWCPHTATAAYVRARQQKPHWILVATAHPAKFDTIVEPLINRQVPVPENLQALLGRPSVCTKIKPDLTELRRHLC